MYHYTRTGTTSFVYAGRRKVCLGVAGLVKVDVVEQYLTIFV